MSDAEGLHNFRVRLLGSALSTYVAVMLVVPLKLYCRARQGGLANLKSDDALTISALLFANCFTWLSLTSKYNSLRIKR